MFDEWTNTLGRNKKKLCPSLIYTKRVAYQWTNKKNLCWFDSLFTMMSHSDIVRLLLNKIDKATIFHL